MNSAHYSRTTLSRIENGRYILSLALAEKLCQRLDVGLARLFADQRRFEALLAVEDSLAAEVIPFLKQLSAKQKEYILKVLAAAPKSGPTAAKTSRA